MFAAAAAGVIVSMALALIRALAGPTLWDRVLAVNTFGTKTVLLIAVLGFLAGRPEFLDLALVYALINFVATIGVLRFFEAEAVRVRSGASAGDAATREAGAGGDA
ncbi:MAG: pH regulation protein F [Gemmatimonadetes bacterium]|nr:pH regulation protein F [Gemmatimonadota bacterium]